MHRPKFVLVAATLAALTLGACSSDTASTPPSAEPTASPQPASRTFTAEVWADNWFALYVDGALVGEDPVPINTERSFNAETITFEASYPFTVGVVAKDFKEDDTGLENIGTNRQRIGDGGVIVQITDTTTGQVVAATDAKWKALVIDRGPVNPECEKDANPSQTCRSEIEDEPAGWADPGFDDSSWAAATVYTESQVEPRDGYSEITWKDSAELVWGDDLEIDNTVLLRFTVTGD